MYTNTFVQFFLHDYLNDFFLAGRDFCCLLIIDANILDPDLDRQNVSPDLDPNRLALWKCSWQNFFEKVNFEKKISK